MWFWPIVRQRRGAGEREAGHLCLSEIKSANIGDITEVYMFKELIQFVLTTIDRRRLLLPIPFWVAKLMGQFVSSRSRTLFFARRRGKRRATLGANRGDNPDGIRDLKFRPVHADNDRQLTERDLAPNDNAHRVLA